MFPVLHLIFKLFFPYFFQYSGIQFGNQYYLDESE